MEFDYQDQVATNWREFTDPNSGKQYFVNLLTGEKQWDRPPGFNFVPPPPPTPPPDMPAQKRQFPDPQKQPRAYDEESDSETSSDDETWNSQNKYPEQFVPAANYDTFEDEQQTQWHLPPVLQQNDHLSLKERNEVRSTRGKSILQTIKNKQDFDAKTPKLSSFVHDYGSDSDSSDDDSDFSENDEVGQPLAPPPPGFAAPTSDVDPIVPAAPNFAAPKRAIVRDFDSDDDGDFTPTPGFADQNVYNINSKVVENVNDSDDEPLDGDIRVSEFAPTEWRDWAKDNYIEYPMVKYAKEYFVPEKSGIFSSRTHRDDLKYQKKQLGHSLTSNIEDDQKKAKTTFKLISKYSGDRPSSQEPHVYLQQLIRQALNEAQEIHDEVYCQLIKQTSNNPNESNVRVWQMFACVCCFFPPSQSLIRYIAAYIYGASLQQNTEAGKWAEFALTQLDYTWAFGRRVFQPTDDEILAVERRQKVNIVIKFLDGEENTIVVHSQTRVKDAMQSLATSLKLNKPELYGIYEIEKESAGWIQNFFRKLKDDKSLKKADRIKAMAQIPVERKLEDSDRILDIISGWQYGPMRTRKNLELIMKVRITLKAESSSLSKTGLKLHFIQAAYNINYGYYPCPEKMAWTLAAIQVQANYGPHEDENFWKGGLLADSLHQLLPWDVFEEEPNKMAAEVKILTYHGNYENDSKQSSYRMYLDSLYNLDQLDVRYGIRIFPCLRVSRKFEDDNSGELVLIGVCESGLTLIDPFDENEPLQYGLDQILSFGFRPQETFSFIAGEIRKQQKWRLATISGQEICNLLMAYIDFRVQVDELYDDEF